MSVKNSFSFKRSTVFLLVLSSTFAACATPNGAQKDCSGNAKVYGAVAGALFGGWLGNKIGDGKTESMLIGAVAGGFLGQYIGSEMDRRRCELDKIAKANGVEIQSYEYELKGNAFDNNDSADVATSSAESKKEISAGKVDIVSLPGISHFAPGAATLTPEAKKYFSEAAEQYLAETAADSAWQGKEKAARMLNQQLSEAEKTEFRTKFISEINQRPIVLVGHTDDTGDSFVNQQLSEKRSKAVAEIFKAKGVPSSRLYFRGAGDSDPIADNRQDNGRAINRRVDIVELESTNKLANFVALKRPNTNYFRPKSATPDPVLASKDEAPVSAEVKQEKIAVQSKTAGSKPSTVQVAKAAGSKSDMPKSWLDFGGDKAKDEIDPVVLASVGKAIEPEKSILKAVSSYVISEANASVDQKVFELPCTSDAPRFGGQYLSLQSGKTVGAETKTSDYLPGMYQTSWVGVVNGHYLGVTPVGVLRENYQPASVPKMLVYANTTTPGANAKSTLSVPMQVNVYPGEKGVLYRMYATGKSNLVCADVVLPRKAPFVSQTGRLYYKRPEGIYSASYQPEMLGAKN